MSIQADNFAEVIGNTRVFIEEKSTWFIAKPYKEVFIKRFKDAIKVLKGDAIAVHFYWNEERKLKEEKK